MTELNLLEAARGGDELAFRSLIDPRRGELQAHCYRMLGSVHDAEDAMQETLLRAWRGLGQFDSSRALRPWLYRIATNACLDMLAKRRPRGLPVDGGPAFAPESGAGRPVLEHTWVEPYPDVEGGYAAPEARYEQRESVELAFIAALQHLPARQRAVLILREVLGFSAREVAQSLGTTAASVNSALQRAHKTVDERLPDHSQQATLRSLGDDGLRDVVQKYLDAWETRNVDALVAILAEDVTFAMPPHPHWFRGRSDVIAFITGTGTPALRSRQTTANGQPAIGWYMLDPEGRTYRPTALEVLGLKGERVNEITAFVWPELFGRFGLAEELPA